MFRCNLSAHWKHCQGMSLRYDVIVLVNLKRLFTKNSCYHQGFFRRETASGFYPWGNVVSPRKRVAEGLCGWRHGNSFPMPPSRTIPLPNAKHSTLLQGCFLCFCFFIPLTIRQQSIIYPHIFSTDSLKPHLYRYYSIGIGG